MSGHELIEADVPGAGRLVRVTAPFDKAVEALRARGARAPIALAELAAARVRAGAASPLCSPGAFVAEAVLYRRGMPVMVVRSSPLLDLQAARAAAAAHDEGREIRFG